MNLDLVYLPHALARMKERGIAKKDIEYACRFPDKVERSAVNIGRLLVKKVYFNELFKRDHLLMIICDRDAHSLQVVTVIDTSKIRKYL